MNYTVGNWTVTSLTTDTITAAKTISIPDLDYSADFVKTEDEPTEGKIANTTGSDLSSPEVIRYAKTAVADVYNNTNIAVSERLPVRAGVRTLNEVTLVLTATNSVSGAEIRIPLRGWCCFQIPTASVVTPDAVKYLMQRTFASSYNKGSVTEDRIVDVAKGALLPDSL